MRDVGRGAAGGDGALDVENICPAFLAFWERAQACSIEEQRRLWHALYEDQHQDVFDVYYRTWGDPQRLDAALGHFPTAAPAIRARLPAIESSIGRMTPRCASLFGLRDDDVRYLLMVGLFMSNAWATSLRGRATCFVAAEIEATARGLDITVAHEAAHAFHSRRTEIDLNTTAVGAGLFLEGMAVLASGAVVPEASEASLLWFDGERTPQGQSPHEWVAACERQWPILRRHLLDNLDATDEARFAGYFYASEAMRLEGVPMRAGYFAGYRIARLLSRSVPVADMAGWPVERGVREVRAMLEQARECPTGGCDV